MATAAKVDTEAKSTEKVEAKADATLSDFFKKSQSEFKKGRNHFIQAIEYVKQHEISRQVLILSLKEAGYTEGSAKVEASRIFTLLKPENEEKLAKLKNGEITVAEARAAKEKSKEPKSEPNYLEIVTDELTNAFLLAMRKLTVPEKREDGSTLQVGFVKFVQGTNHKSTDAFEVEDDGYDEFMADIVKTAYDQAIDDYVSLLKDIRAKVEEKSAKKEGEVEAAKKAQMLKEELEKAEQAEEQKALTGVSA